MMVSMRFLASITFMILFLAPFAHAEVKTIKEISISLEKAARAGDSEQCNRYATTRSKPYIKRLLSYKFQEFIPQHITYSNAVKKGPMQVINASTMSNGQENFVELVFIREQNQWKFDFPESMRRGFGEDWEQKLKELEQFYLMMQQAR